MASTNHVLEKFVKQYVKRKMDKLSYYKLLFIISPNQSVNKTIEFIHENLLIYATAGSALLSRNMNYL
jgi:hypothetical protein